MRLVRRNDPRWTLEVHRWMHDRVSLRLLLEECGFVGYAVKEFDDSAIPGWREYDLDRASNDYPLEPFIFVECRKAREG
jgi:hypothetical protein